MFNTNDINIITVKRVGPTNYTELEIDAQYLSHKIKAFVHDGLGNGEWSGGMKCTCCDITELDYRDELLEAIITKGVKQYRQ